MPDWIPSKKRGIREHFGGDAFSNLGEFVIAGFKFKAKGEFNPWNLFIIRKSRFTLFEGGGLVAIQIELGETNV